MKALRIYSWYSLANFKRHQKRFYLCPFIKLSKNKALKGTCVEKKVKLKWKSVKNAKNRAITDLIAPNGSRHIPFQSQEFGQDGHRHFVGFQPHFQLNMTSQTQYCKTVKKWKYNVSEVFWLICLKLCRLLELGKEILLHFKFCCCGNQNQNYCLLSKKQKACCLSKSNVRKVIWNNTVWLLLQVVSSFEDKWVIHYSYCEKTIVFCFWIKTNYSHLSCHSNEI